MDPQCVLVALGGNAIAGERGAGPEEQRLAVEEAAWDRPTKPIGRRLREAEAQERIAAGERWEPQGERGWRRVVLDKDLTGALPARTVGADCFVIATDVEAAAIGFGTPEQRWLGEIRAGGLRALVGEGHFASGSMGPKVDAALRFAEGGGRQAAITSLKRVREGVAGTAGTVVRA